MKSEKLRFSNTEGQTLVGRMDVPKEGEPIAYALFAHCFTCSKDLSAVSNISRELNKNGIGVFRFDFTGLGESSGDFADTNFSSNVEDLVEAAHFMADQKAGPHLLIGHSLGGAAVLHATKHIPSVEAVVTIGAPSNPIHVENNFHASLDEIEKKGEAKVILSGREFTIKKQFLEDLSATKMQKSIKELKKPLLILHSPIDTTVGVDNASEIFMAAKHPKSFISLDLADHLLSRREDSIYVAKTIAGWVSKYVEQPKKSEQKNA